MKKSVFWLLILLICLLAFSLRLYKFNNPIADWHSWRQVDTAAVARNFDKFGFDPLRPRYDDLSNIQSGKDNLLGYRMVEFPIYQSIAFGLHKVVRYISIEQALRLVTILASILSTLLIGLIGAKTVNKLSGLSSAFIFAILPYSVFYGRAILPEALMVFTSLFSVYLALVSIKQISLLKYLLIFCSALLAGLALLIKPTAVFIMIPLPYLFLKSIGLNFKFLIISIICLIISLTPIYFWRKWILQFPEGIPVYTWLLNEGNIRFKGAWFYWIFSQRIAAIILGYWGLVFLVLGVIRRKSKNNGLLLPLILIGSLLYVIVIARGNVQHDYYQVPIMPIISLYSGLGIDFLLRKNNLFSRSASFICLITCLSFSLMFSWYTIRGYYWINHEEIIKAGIAADKLLPKDAKVIAPYNGDTTFLYHTNRQGWPIGFEIEKKISLGATHYVTISASDADFETNELVSKYKVLERNADYAIIDLTKIKE